MEKEIKEKRQKEKEKRRSINEDLIRRLKKGEALQDFDYITWYPPRPMIQKDEKHVRELYGTNIKVVGKPIENPKLVHVQTTEREKNGEKEDYNEPRKD